MWNETPWRTVIKDIVLMGIGSIGMVHEEFFRSEPSLPLIGAYLTILGVPFTEKLWQLFRNSNGEFSSLPPRSPSSRSLPSSDTSKPGESSDG